ncbi:2-oxo acid dehydrogenase subunit E2 [Candidatus Saccharibacteria bacterium]|nr:2-oxo acid dehydrogenase subunit E2 [Candidatus Saccharibacteria bacterium]
MKKYGGAHRVKNVSGLSQISIDLKPHRSVSDVYINQKMDLTNLVKYVDEQKKANTGVTLFHSFLAAIAKTVYTRPKLNYFVANHHLYEHEKVVLAFIAKVSFDDHAEEMMVMIPIGKNDDVFTIGDKIEKKVASFREKKPSNIEKKGANSAIDVLGKMPNIIRVPLIGCLKWTDKKGFLPSSLAKDNLYYSTMIVSNLGSIGCGAIFHNINDFGNSSSLLTMGEIKDEEVIENGKKSVRKICEWGMNFDERIADGYYFAKSADVLEYILNNPKLLEEPVGQKVELPEPRK